jgi:hypothetical protein
MSRAAFSILIFVSGPARAPSLALCHSGRCQFEQWTHYIRHQFCSERKSPVGRILLKTFPPLTQRFEEFHRCTYVLANISVDMALKDYYQFCNFAASSKWNVVMVSISIFCAITPFLTPGCVGPHAIRRYYCIKLMVSSIFDIFAQSHNSP